MKYIIGIAAPFLIYAAVLILNVVSDGMFRQANGAIVGGVVILSSVILFCTAWIIEVIQEQ